MLSKNTNLPALLKAAINSKIFCISMQRTGTSSVGKFFKDHDYRVATWDYSIKNNWTLKWFSGDYNAIFKSNAFRYNQVFEDDPWWCDDFYKILFHRFHNSKFILFERDADKWFDSMVRHSNGKNLGNTHIHANLYHRLDAFYKENLDYNNYYSGKTDNILDISEINREHYTRYYRHRNLEVKRFFQHFGNSRIICLSLEDSEKWKKLSSFFSIPMDDNYNVHVK